MDFRLHIPPSASQTFRCDFYAQLLFAGVMGLTPLAAVVARKALDASDVEVALIHSAMFMGFLLSFLTAGPSSRGRKMPWAVWPKIVGHGLLLLLVFATSSLLFTVTLIVAVAVAQLALPAMTAIYSMNYPDDSRGRLLGIIRTVQGLFLVAFTFLGGLAMDRVPETYRVFFPLAGVFGIVGAIVFSRIRERSPDSAGPLPAVAGGLSATLSRAWAVFRENRVFAAFMATWFFFGFANIMARPAAAMYFVDAEYGVEADYVELSLLTTIIPQGMMLLTMYFWGRVFDRVSVITLRGTLQIFWASELLLFYLSNDITVLYCGTALRGMAASGTNLVWNIGVIRFAKPRDVPLYMGIHTALTGLRGVVAPHVGVALKAAVGLKPVFLLGFLIMVVASLALLFLPKTDRPPEPGGAEGGC